jgi:hypothetical protein
MSPEIKRPTKRITRNLMQLAVRVATQKIKVVVAGRGSGKTTVLADEVADVVHDMPRATNFMQGVTFQQMLTLTLGSFVDSMATLGYINGLHYFIGRKAPASWRWPEAYQPPLKYDKAIYFYNGSTYLLFSQDVANRGPNTASGVADECALLDPVRFQSEAIATLRLKPSVFGKCRRYLSQTYTTSIARTQLGKFIYTYEDEAKKNPQEVLFLRASSHINKANLPPSWFTNQQRMMSKYDYDIEIGNKEPKAMKGGFYPLFSEGKHTYTAFNNDYLSGLLDDGEGFSKEKFEDLDCRQDADWYPNAPLDISLDYGKFNCIVTGQETMNMCRFLGGMSYDSPKQTQDLVETWCKYYRFHQDKCVHYWYDSTAQGKDGRSPKSYSEIVIDTLIANGWEVIQHYYGKAPDHVDKYNFWSIAMRNDHPMLPHFSWNQHNCKYVIASITGAGAKEGTNGIEKIKTDEKKDTLDQRYTTHFSDACDMLAYFKYAHLLKESGIWLPTQMM